MGPHEVEVGQHRLDSRFVLLCTGSRPAVPPIAGLDEAGSLTSETVFGISRAPASLVVVGGGPIAVELAQAMARLGVGVTLLEMLPTILAREEPELVERLRAVLVQEGLGIHVGVRVERVSVEDGRKVVHGREGEDARRWEADEVLVATGGSPNVGGLGLAELGVAVGRSGIGVDEAMRTAVPSIYAAGDVAGRYLFTHSAAHDAASGAQHVLSRDGARWPSWFRGARSPTRSWRMWG
ncbi:MAG: FAD-dependent oxidoreductase [Acidimicrobiales bacterium]